jgi:hypothetical protein
VNRTPDRIRDAIRSLQRVSDEQLVDSARSSEAKALLERIVSTEEPSPEPRAEPRVARRRPGSLIAIVVAVALAVAAAAGAWLVTRADPMDRSEFHVGAAKGPPDPNVAYVDIAVDGTESRAELRAMFKKLRFDVDLTLVPASPLLQGKILAAGGRGGGEQIRELRQDCPTLAPCDLNGLKVPKGFDGSARIALGRAPRPGEPYVHVWAFQPDDPHVLALVGRRAADTRQRISARAWAGARPVWYRLDSGEIERDFSSIRNYWVVDAITDGGSVVRPSRAQSPRIVLAVAPRRESPPKPFWMPERFKRYQQLAQRFG